MSSPDLASHRTPALTVFRPVNTLGSAYGGVVILFSAGIATLLLYKGITEDVALGQIFLFADAGLFLALGILYAYWTWGCRSLSYVIDRNSLSIRWGGLRQVVPLDKIDRLIPGDEVENPHIEGISWLGHHVGMAYVQSVGQVLFYSTHRTMREVLYIQTEGGTTYGISVQDPVVFAETIQSNQARGSLFDQRQAVHRWGVAAQSFWLDANARLLTAILLAAFFAVLGYTLYIYPGLAQSVPLRFPSLEGVVRVSDKSALLDIPRSALGFLTVNIVLAVMLHSWERMVGYVLLLAGIAVQITLLVAVAVAVA